MQEFYLVALSFVEIFGDFSLERYAHTGSINALFVGIIGYIGVVFFLIQSLANSNILYVNGMWDGISCLMESIAAYWLLGERFERWEQYIGLIMIIVGVLLVRSNKKQKWVKLNVGI